MRVLKEALKNLFKKPITIRYPKAPSPTPDGFRGKPDLYRKRCIGCGACVKNCPSSAIKLKDNGKIEIDLFRCIFCGVCQEVCPVDAIKLTREFELTILHKDLIRLIKWDSIK